ncbi:MAG: hypothetical protein KJ725_01905 [Gammaproteobacteria bacterium]|nr:hypothetical protein [Gammaproteobacteria bacterium]
MKTFDKVSHSAHEAFDKMADSTSHAAEAIGEKGVQLKNAEQQMVNNCRNYIREYPIISVVIASAGGFLLSRLLTKKSR